MYLGYSFIADFRCQLICQSLIWEWGSVYTRDGLYASMYGKSQAEMFLGGRHLCHVIKSDHVSLNASIRGWPASD